MFGSWKNKLFDKDTLYKMLLNKSDISLLKILLTCMLTYTDTSVS